MIIKQIKTVSRKAWHRPSDRFQWIGWYGKRSARSRPDWDDYLQAFRAKGYSHSGPPLGKDSTKKERRESLRRIV